MKALTVRQPWAWAIAAGHKDVENRVWRPPLGMIGQRFAIHAGKSIDLRGFGLIEEQGIELPAELAAGRLLCTVRLVAVVTEHESPWFVGPFGWVVDDPQPTEPRELLGKLGLWEIPQEG